VFSNKDIISIMTRNAAAAVGKSDELGTLEPGKLADIVILDGDPLEDIHAVLNVKTVIKEGKVLVDN
jgi:imidazolonepropionase-like amidohydrolase